MKKKVLFIILPIVLAILIVGGIIAGILLTRNKSVGTTWGDTYYAYLKEAINEKDLHDAEEKYGIKLDMKNAQLQFCEVDGNETPSMIMTYNQNGSDYVNIYQINDDKKVTYVSYKQPTKVEFLYNIEKDEYNWYIHKYGSSNDSYSSLKNIVNNLKNNSTKSEKSENVNVADLEADYTINKDESEITQQTIDGNTLSMQKFDQIFVRPEITPNEKIDFNINIKEKDLKKSLTTAIQNYKEQSKILTDNIKEEVSKKAEESKNKMAEIENAKKKITQQEEMKVTKDNVISKLGDHLKYFSACYLGTDYGPYQLYKLNDVTGKVNIPGVNNNFMMVYEVVGLNSISELKDKLKEYMTDDVISKLKSGENGDLIGDMHEYNNKVYVARGGIGDGPAVYWDKAKLLSSDGNTTKVELEDYFVLGDFVDAKITVTFNYDEEKSKFIITDYSVKKVEQTSSNNNSQSTASSSSSSSNNSTSSVNSSSQSSTHSANSSSTSSSSETPTMPNAISKEEALKLAQNRFGTKDSDTGYQIGYTYAGWIQDTSGMQYYVFSIRWFVGDHWSFLDLFCVSADGKTYKDIGLPKNITNGEIVTDFDGGGNL